jgi:hypothetical protein
MPNHLRARTCHPTSRRLARELKRTRLTIIALTDQRAACELQLAALQTQVTELQAELTALISPTVPTEPTPAKPSHAKPLTTHLAKLTRPSQAIPLLTRTNGPTVYWLCQKHFAIDRSTADAIRRQHHDRWPDALRALDPHAF